MGQSNKPERLSARSFCLCASAHDIPAVTSNTATVIRGFPDSL